MTSFEFLFIVGGTIMTVLGICAMIWLWYHQ